MHVGFPLLSPLGFIRQLKINFILMKQELYSYLSQFVLKRRLELFETLIKFRTRFITVVLEDPFQSQNASAVIRTCDCFGIQDIHCIENVNKFKLDKEVTLGSDKWLNINIYKQKTDNTVKTINSLKSDGYRIIATLPHKNGIDLQDLDLSKGKVALLFGTELTGLSKDAITNSDEYLTIPMYGFTESYNLSVAVSLSLQFLIGVLHKMEKKVWQLSEDERIDVLLSWVRKSIRKVDLIERRFISMYPS